VASLNLYSRVPVDMAGLITRVVALYCHDASPARVELDNGGEHLLEALAAALNVHDDIQHALGVLIGSRRLSAPDPYTVLSELAESHGVGLYEAATDLLEGREA
jgi:AmiR/NasT family two-component response regulator